MFVLRVSWSLFSGLPSLGESRSRGAPAGLRKRSATGRMSCSIPGRAGARSGREPRSPGRCARGSVSCTASRGPLTCSAGISSRGASEPIDAIAGRVWMLGSRLRAAAAPGEFRAPAKINRERGAAQAQTLLVEKGTSGGQPVRGVPTWDNAVPDQVEEFAELLARLAGADRAGRQPGPRPLRRR
jgi:hypothetical protein